MFLLLGSLQITLVSFKIGEAWDIRRQREIEAHAVAQIVKECSYKKFETSASTAKDSLSRLISDSLIAAWPNPSLVIKDTTQYGTITTPANPQFPHETPVNTRPLDFKSPEGQNIGRNLQALLSAGPVADLGLNTFSFQKVSSPEAPLYEVNVRHFSVPLTNFNWIAYGDPKDKKGVTATRPNFPRVESTSGEIVTPLCHAYTVGNDDTTSDLYPSTLASGNRAASLPGAYYRELVSLTWNAFAYWTATDYQDQAYDYAEKNGWLYKWQDKHNIPNQLKGALTCPKGGQNPEHPRAGETWLDLGKNLPPLIVFEDTGNNIESNTLRLEDNSVTAPSEPVVIMIRNNPNNKHKTIIKISEHIKRPVLLYAPYTMINPLSSLHTLRGAVLFFPDSELGKQKLGEDIVLHIKGSIFYPQTSGNTSLNTSLVKVENDDGVKEALAKVVPRALLLSSRGVLK